MRVSEIACSGSGYQVSHVSGRTAESNLACRRRAVFLCCRHRKGIHGVSYWERMCAGLQVSGRIAEWRFPWMSNKAVVWNTRERFFHLIFLIWDVDAQAYKSVGVPLNRIFLVDETSRVCVRETRGVYDSYVELMPHMARFFPDVKEVRSTCYKQCV